MNIGQASAASGVSPRMIRYYEKLELIPPPARRDSRYRKYSADDIARLRFVADAREVGFEAEEIRGMLVVWVDARAGGFLDEADAERVTARLAQKRASLARIGEALLARPLR